MNAQRKAMQNLRRLPHLTDLRWLESDDVDAACDVIEPGLHRTAQPRKFRLQEAGMRPGKPVARTRRH